MLELATFQRVTAVLLRLILDEAPPTTIELVVEETELAVIHPIKSTMVLEEISISPTDFPSILNSSVIALPVPVTLQAFETRFGRSFICGECPVP